MSSPKFTGPDSKDPHTWRETVQGHFQSMPPCPEAVRHVLKAVQSAVQTGAVHFRSGEVPAVLDFVNAVLDSARQVDPTVDAWQFGGLVPPSVALFVQPTQNGTFEFKPMFTL